MIMMIMAPMKPNSAETTLQNATVMKGVVIYEMISVYA
jgi:hypothetical protein